MTVVEPGAARYTPTASELMARTRLRVPDAPSFHLDRERLSGLLASTSAPLTLLSAPAGSGKTALAVEWAHRARDARDVVWVSCQGDVDPWADVVHGLGGDDTGAVAGGSLRQRRSPRDLVGRVLEAAGRGPRPWTVFLDAYDLRSADSAEALDLLLTHAGGDLQVVLTTRADPVLPLHRYRLAGAVLEVRAADLAFTDDEAGALLRAGGVELEPADLHALNERLAGWAAGLCFAIPTLAGHPAPREVVASAVTYNGNINAYLVEEVLDAQPAPMRDLILATSVPDTLPPALLEELTGEPAAPTTLRLLRSNVFVQALPGDESCLRYVPFFRDLVRAQLAYEAPGRFRELHRTVAAWYADQGEWESAVAHLDNAGERPDCAGLLVDHLLVGRLLCEQLGDSFRRLVANALPTAATGTSEHLLRAASALADGDHEDCSAHLDAARGAGEPSTGAAVARDVIEAVLTGLATDAGRTDQLAARAEDRLAAHGRPGRPGAEDSRAVVLMARAVAALRTGAVGRAERLLETCLATSTASWSTTYRCRCLAHAALLHARGGDLSRAVAEADEAVALARLGAASTASATTAHLARAYAALAAGDVISARAHLAETCAPPDPLWQVVQAVVAAALERPDDEDEALRRFGVAAAAAERAGTWATDWVRDEVRGVRPAHAGSWVIGADGRVVEPLTPRELEVLAAMSEWLTTEEIADKLFVSVNTVRTHVRNILTKLGVSRRNAAIREAFRLGLLTSDAPGVLEPHRVRSG